MAANNSPRNATHPEPEHTTPDPAPPFPILEVIVSDDADMVRVPILGTASAGNGQGRAYSSGEQDDDAFVFVDKREVRGRELLAVRVKGTCMQPLLYEGDVVICEHVRRPEQAPSGSLCVAWVVDDDDLGGNVKYVDWASETTARLRGEDGTTKVGPRARLVVQGRVLELRRKL